MSLGDDVARLDELRRYELFSAGDPDLDRLAELAARVSGTPIAAITFLDDREQRLLARWGVPPSIPYVMPLEQSICAHALVEPAAMVVIEDLLANERLAALPLVATLDARFYASVPLTTPGGQTLGTVCVLDRHGRALEPVQARELMLVRDEVMMLLEARRELTELRRSEGLRQEAVEALMATQHDLEARIELRTREVEEAHKKTRTLLERIGDAYVALDRDWRFVYVNQRAGELLQREPATLVGKHLFTEFPEDGEQPFRRAYERAMREQTMVTLEAEYRRWGRWFESRVYPSRDGVSVFFTELTERRRAEAEAARSRQQLVDAQRVAHVGSWEWDVASNTVTWSDELYRIYGLPIGSALGGYEGFLSRVHADDLELTRNTVGGVLQAGLPAPFVYDHRIVRPDGSVRWLHTRGELIVDDNGPKRLIGCCWDVTDLRLAEDAQRRTVALLEATLEVAADALAVVDADGTVTAYNAKLAALFGLPAERRPLPFESLAAALREPEVLRARVGADGHDTRDKVTLRDGRALEARSQPHVVGGQTAGRVWSFRPA